ncbi:hypothetical protein MTO96_052031 [Rhipicephalus appendiculatus]
MWVARDLENTGRPLVCLRGGGQARFWGGEIGQAVGRDPHAEQLASATAQYGSIARLGPRALSDRALLPHDSSHLSHRQQTLW